jgi:metal-responsive CopG/Arc/MetJ family transcriptional regulator
VTIISIRVDDFIIATIDKKVKQHHLKRSDFIRDAILSKLEDLEDLEAFEKTKNDKLYSLDEVRKNLGLED